MQEFPVPPGSHRLQVRFASELPPGAGRVDRAPVLLDQILTLEPRTIALVTYDDAAARLHVVGASADPLAEPGASETRQPR